MLEEKGREAQERQQKAKEEYNQMRNQQKAKSDNYTIIL